MRHSSWSCLALGIVVLSVSNCQDRPAQISPEPSGDERVEQTFRVDLERDYRELSRIRIASEFKHGKIIGVRVFFSAGDAGAARRFGFHLLDLIEAVDGGPVATDEAVLEAFSRMGRAPEVRFQVRRRERRLTLVYRPAKAGAGE